VDLRADADRLLGRLAVESHEVGWGQKGLVNREIGICGVFDIPLVGKCVPADHHLEPRVLEDEAHRPVARMNGWYGSNRYAILLVDDGVDGFVVELGHVDLARLGTENEVSRRRVPVVGPEEVLDGVGGSHVRRCPFGPPYAQRLRSPGRPTAGPERRQVTPVVRV